jgi:hypothetical protein
LPFGEKVVRLEELVEPPADLGVVVGGAELELEPLEVGRCVVRGPPRV